MLLSPEVSARVVELIAEEIAAAGRQVAQDLVAQVLTGVALPAPSTEASDDFVGGIK